MDGGRRKRKLENEEESEEKQMEMFFALVKSTKDVRGRLSKCKEKGKAKGVWNPTFLPEDFIDDEELARINISHPPSASSSEKEKEIEKVLPEAEAAETENKERAGDNLDLRLSL
ncbi:unnamed protein product [Lupinus luteus]|uniref:NPR1/NH1-interacting protein n=1 Tax=Lupinus luteus TaxID=3873 RepID=A0AAV1VSZ9_LUPLU